MMRRWILTVYAVLPLQLAACTGPSAKSANEVIPTPTQESTALEQPSVSECSSTPFTESGNPPHIGARLEGLSELFAMLERHEGGVLGEVISPSNVEGNREPGSARTATATWYFYSLGSDVVAVRHESNQSIDVRMFANRSNVVVVEATPDHTCPRDSGDCAERFDLPEGEDGSHFYCLSDYNAQCVQDGERVSIEVFTKSAETTHMSAEFRRLNGLLVEMQSPGKERICSNECCWTMRPPQR